MLSFLRKVPLPAAPCPGNEPGLGYQEEACKKGKLTSWSVCTEGLWRVDRVTQDKSTCFLGNWGVHLPSYYSGTSYHNYLCFFLSFCPFPLSYPFFHCLLLSSFYLPTFPGGLIPPLLSFMGTLLKAPGLFGEAMIFLFNFNLRYQLELKNALAKKQLGGKQKVSSLWYFGKWCRHLILRSSVEPRMRWGGRLGRCIVFSSFCLHLS